jgi:hypothetical protein
MRFLLLALLLSACIPVPYENGRPLTSDAPMLGLWELTEMHAERGLTALPMTHRVSLLVPDGSHMVLEGDAFVHPYSGRLRLDAVGNVVEPPTLDVAPPVGRRSLLRERSVYGRPFDRDSVGAPEESYSGNTNVADERPRETSEDIRRWSSRALDELESEYFRQWRFAERVVVSEGELQVFDGRDRLVLRFERPAGAEKRLPWEPKRGR